jgi:hypothetical protein
MTRRDTKQDKIRQDHETTQFTRQDKNRQHDTIQVYRLHRRCLQLDRGDGVPNTATPGLNGINLAFNMALGMRARVGAHVRVRSMIMVRQG